jgi:hypothetical protein
MGRAKNRPRLFADDKTRRLIAAGEISMRAKILLRINCGFGKAKCGRLPLSAVDLDAGMIDSPCTKTGISRRCSS